MTASTDKFMLQPRQLTDRIAIAGVLHEADFAAAKAAGFTTVINFRPDGESPNQVPSALAREAAEAAGLSYHYVPTTKYEVLTDEVLDQAARIFAAEPGPILAHCASGQRAAIVWAATAARATPVDRVLVTLRQAGLELDFLRDELEAQADRVRLAALSSANASAQDPESAATDAVTPLNRERRPDDVRHANPVAA